MRLSIIVEDNAVVKNNSHLTIALDAPSDVHALQWFGTKGEIELPDRNEEITELPQWALDAVASFDAEYIEPVIYTQAELDADDAAYNAILDVFPKANQEYVDNMIELNLDNINFERFYRYKDSNLIGLATKGFSYGAKGLASLRDMRDLQDKYGVPLFGYLNPAEATNVAALEALYLSLGYELFHGIHFTFAYPTWNLEKERSKKISDITSDAAISMQSGYLWGGNTYDTDVSGRSNVNAKVIQLLLDQTITTVDWRLSDNTTIKLSAANFKQMASDMTDHIEALYVDSWDKKSRAAVAADKGELNAIK